MTTHYALGPAKLTEALERVMLRGLVPYVQGSPGIGKSDIYRKIAKKWNLKLIDVRLSQCAPEDLNGLPFRNGNKAAFLPFENFPIEGDPLPLWEGETEYKYDEQGNCINCYAGWLILLDELSSAPKSVQAAAYKLILDQEVGIHKLHSCVMLGAAGNKATDKAVVVSQSTALQSRLIHFELMVSHADWMTWANHNKVDSRLIGFLSYKKASLHMFQPDHQDRTFPCPRTWAFVDRMIRDRHDLDDIDAASIAGAVGDGQGTEFFKFAQIQDNVPTIADIIRSPDKTEVPNEASFKFFITSALMDHATKDNLDPIFVYLNRMDQEFQVIFLRGAAQRDATLRSHKTYAAHLTKLIRFVNNKDNESYDD